jgi:superfamily II DNA helicase RecQ
MLRRSVFPCLRARVLANMFRVLTRVCRAFVFLEVCEDYEKPRRLQRIMERIVDKEGSKIIIFTETKKNADILTRNMRQDGWPALAIHGDKQQVPLAAPCSLLAAARAARRQRVRRPSSLAQWEQGQEGLERLGVRVVCLHARRV